MSSSKQIQKLKQPDDIIEVPETGTETVSLPSTTVGEEQQQAEPVVGTENAQQTPKTQLPKILEKIKETIIQVSQDHMDTIVKDLKDGFLRLECVDSKGKLSVDRRQYSPMTIGMNKKVVKVGKKLRLLEADIKGMGEDGALDVGQIQQKYPEILEEDVDEYDLTNETAYGEIRTNYIVAQKAKIYWGIDNIENYSLHDLMIVQNLYESRNTFAPSL